MKPKTLILMVVAIGCGLVASYMTSRVIADRSEKPTEEKVAVLVARQNIAMGTVIKEPEKLFEEKQFTKGEEPKKAIREFDGLKGKVLNKPLGAEQFVTADDLTDKENTGLSGQLPKGMRAYSIKVDAASQVGGFATPHTRVDVVSVVRRSENETYAKIILQNILVLAVDQTGMRPEDKQAVVASTVTLQVTPQQSEALSLAQEMGSLKLILRAFGDEEKIQTPGVTPKGVASAGNDNRSEDAIGGVEDGSRRGSLSIGRIPEVPNGTKVTPVTETKPEPPTKTHTLTIYNGDTVSKAVFTLADKDGQGEPKTEKTGQGEPKIEKTGQGEPKTEKTADPAANAKPSGKGTSAK